MSTFNDDLSADMHDPEFAAEFERATDEVRRERYATAVWIAIPPCVESRYDVEDAADAAMAVADEEKQQIIRDSAVIAEKWSDAQEENAHLRSDLQESADALDESAQLLEDALDENARLRAELASGKAAHRAVWQKHQERGQWIFDLQGEMGNLRDELEEWKKKASILGIQRQRHADKRVEAEDTISRVNAAARKAKSSGNVWDMEDLISAVLNGESE